MKIKTVITQNRRDFTAIFECDHCGHETKPLRGYDDAHYHGNVIPMMKCTECGLAAGDDFRPLATKYPEGQQV
ncbi:hypothetical protein [Sneathiella sp.]|uniref:hypothetical protein n=1 Tax=Sneathiella sp. TaxID=1964365 RepID=UPI003566D838